MRQTVEQVLAASIRTLLRPLVRILLRNGVPHRVFAEFAKQSYVDVAAADFAVTGRKPSISRISVLTGLTRKDVSRLLHSPDDSAPLAEQYNRAARVIGAWVREADFHDGSGRPRVLDVTGPGSFAELVRRSAGDVPHRAVLDELLRVGAVERTRNDRLRLVTRAYVPRTGEQEKLQILGSDVAELVSAIDHNLTHPPEEAFFQRKVAYDNLVEECLPELEERAARRGQSLLEYLDRFMADHDRDASPGVRGTGRGRAVLGVYYYQESSEDSK